MSKFQIDDWVEWTSSSGGFTKTKRGQIVEVVPAGSRPDGNRVRGAGWYRRHESYVVMVRTSPRRKPRYYWPVVSLLKAVENHPSGLSGEHAPVLDEIHSECLHGV